MLRNFWFQLHWLLGITAGLILAVVGFTGGMLSFHDEILDEINASIVNVTPSGEKLAPDELMARILANNPGKRIQSLTIASDPKKSARVVFAPERRPEQNAQGGANEMNRGANDPGRGGNEAGRSANPSQQAAPPRPPRGEMRYVNPYTAELQPPLRGRDFFQTVEQLHRRLLLSDAGKQTVAASTLCLLFLSLSGLYLRWPRKIGDWRAWLTFSTKKKGRGFLWGMHSVVGTWSLLFYLLAGFTGVAMSYDWLRNGLYDAAGVPRPQFGGGNAAGAPGGANRPAMPPVAAAENGGNMPTEEGRERRRQRESSGDEPRRDSERQQFARNEGDDAPRGEGRERRRQHEAMAEDNSPRSEGEGRRRPRESSGDEPRRDSERQQLARNEGDDAPRGEGREHRRQREAMAEDNSLRGEGEGRRRQRESSADEPRRDAERGAGGMPPDAAAAPRPPAFDAAAAWALFQRNVSAYSTATLRIPDRAGQPVQFTYMDPEPQHERAFNRLNLNVATGEVLQHERYADKPLAAQLLGSLLPLHSGAFFGLPVVIIIMLASLAMPLFAVTGWMLYLDRRKNKHAARAEAEAAAAQTVHSSTGETFLIAYASQTGRAEQLAWQTAAALKAADLRAEVHALSQVDADMLGRFRHALFVVSTFGDGQPPDNGRGFLHRVMPRSLPLPGLRFGLAILGDRQYHTFCGFGRSLDLWLHKQGAQPLFDAVEIDNGDPAALQRWREQIAALGADEATLEAQPYGQWRLAERRCLNPGSQGAPVFHIELEPVDPPRAEWISGDIAEVLMRHAIQGNQPAPTRQFSIASLPPDGRVHLLVRQVRLPDGGLGLGSGWLTEQTAIGGKIEMRINPHRGFHLPANDCPLILIGNGTGLAGLRSHLKARAQAGRKRNWLIFGERNAAHDFHYREEIESWQAEGMLERVDLAFSRDQTERIYVQQRIREAADTLRAWVNDGAAIYVCGSLEGMAPAVDEALTDILGAEQVDRLAAEGRYRRDVY